MMKNYPGEQWETVVFDVECTNEFRLEVSNFGRVRSFNKISDGNILNGSMINGYKIIRLKLYKPRAASTQAKLTKLKEESLQMARDLKAIKKEGAEPELITNLEAKLVSFKKNVSKQYQKDLKDRTINYHSLIHRLVADYFLDKPKPGQTIVAHLDYNKVNNRAYNLKWMTPEENYEHQKGSPQVVLDKTKRQERQQSNSKRAKLTVTKVMLLKKLLNEGKPMKQLVKLFKVTETQILRVKKGENWGNIEASK